jgi:hypothetical protein
VLVIFWFFRPVLSIEVTTFYTDEMLYRKEVEPGYTFATLIKHSVHLSPVYEYYKIEKDGRIIITGTKLQDLGWGVPSTFDYDFKFENDFMVIENINKPIGFVPFRISYTSCPHLILDNCERDIDLVQLFDNWERIDIYAKKEPYIFYILRGEVDVFPKKETAR